MQNTISKIKSIPKEELQELISNKEASQQIIFETQKYALKNYDYHPKFKQVNSYYKNIVRSIPISEILQKILKNIMKF